MCELLCWVSSLQCLGGWACIIIHHIFLACSPLKQCKQKLENELPTLQISKSNCLQTVITTLNVVVVKLLRCLIMLHSVYDHLIHLDKDPSTYLWSTRHVLTMHNIGASTEYRVQWDKLIGKEWSPCNTVRRAVGHVQQRVYDHQPLSSAVHVYVIVYCLYQAKPPNSLYT